MVRGSLLYHRSLCSRRWDAGPGSVLQSEQRDSCPKVRSNQDIPHKEAPECEHTWISAGTDSPQKPEPEMVCHM